ncbi:MAG: hypothetical protein NPMRTH1_760008 [Nitrosopumilales archaeon]|nr:MAG: hypothetical protein NPMRTH1_760008 [Nitrosopumilales archaeon]
MILEVAKDVHPFIMLFWARQWGKTTHFASVLGHGASTHNNYDQTYINFELEALKTFSDNKFRKDVFQSFPLSEYIQGISKWGSMSKVSLKTGSTIDMITSLHNWGHAQGKSNQKIVIDEGQDHDWTGWFNLRETQADTMGDTLIGGVGGYEDTHWDRIWKSTDQKEWLFDHGEEYKGYPNMSWRRELERNCFDEKGLVYDQAMLDALDGKWEAQAPRNFSRHGYHLSQLQNPRIPLLKVDAIELYHVPPEFSIEAKLKDPDYTQSEFRRYVLCENVTGETKPITERMMFALMDKNRSFTPSTEVDFELGDVFVGADWGGGPKTVVWVMQCLDNYIPTFLLLFAAKLEGESSDQQYQTVRNIIEAYGAKQAVVDAGGGTHQVEALQKYFGPRCIRNYYLTRPQVPVAITRAERKKFSKHNLYAIDKTYSLDAIADLVKIHGPHGPRLILPGKNFEEIEWIIKQFVNEEVEMVQSLRGGQPYRRYYTPDPKLSPDDALHACNYARLAWMIGRGQSGHYGGAITEVDTDNNDLDFV